jgi:hypothetical protein
MYLGYDLETVRLKMALQRNFESIQLRSLPSTVLRMHVISTQSRYGHGQGLNIPT